MSDNLLLIGVPVHGNMNPAVVTSIISLSATINCPAKIHLQSNCYVHDARNKIVSEALKLGATHLMFIDADMVFPPDGVNKLLEHNLDIVGGLYYRRQPPHLPTINYSDGEKLYIPKNVPNKLFETFAIGTGFLLIKTSVFTKIKPPYFYFGDYHGKAMGEDVYFCWKAKKAGFKVWCDPSINLGHVGEEVYTVDHYKAYKSDLDDKTEAVYDGQL